MRGSPIKKSFLKNIPDPLFDLGCPQKLKTSREGSDKATGFKARPLSEKDRLYSLSNLELDTIKDTRFLVKLLIRTG